MIGGKKSSSSHSKSILPSEPKHFLAAVMALILLLSNPASAQRTTERCGGRFWIRLARRADVP